jgi:thioredoxin-like negative regulator of GroEL
MEPRALRQSAVVAALALALGGCAGSGTEQAPPPRVAQASGDAHGEVLPFLHDDFPRALAKAKEEKKPLFVDTWAPWCHTCLSMRAYVLTDPSLAPLASEFVWLSIDTEKDENASFVSRFHNEAWPTLWVLDPQTEQPLLKWAGSATAPELRELLTAVRAPGQSEVTVAFLRANHEVARGEVDAAIHDLRSALSAAGDAHPQRARILEALADVLSARDKAACADLALHEGAAMSPGTSRATVLSMGLLCAVDGKLTGPAASLEAAALAAARDPDPRTLADDRSALYEAVVEAREAASDTAGERRVGAEWASFLEREAAKATTNEARAVFDAHRLEAYIAMGEPARAVPMLSESERQFPSDYNPPARLAKAYLETKELDLAKAAIDRAAARVYGPRSMRVFDLAADIAKARGDGPGERAALEQALARTERAVLSPGQTKLRAGIAKRLSELRP